jgi:4-hydroxybenzoate polyprenyltransferase
MSAPSSTRGWLVLSRLSNLPTVATNVIAAAAVSGVVAGFWTMVALVVAMSLIYTAGMMLNDICDLSFDRAHRAGRPLVTGAVSLRAAWVAVALLSASGIGIVGLVAVDGRAVIWTLVLVAVVAYYDVTHKRDVLAPLAMGACRGLVYLATAAALAGSVIDPVWDATVLMTTYVAAITAAARYIPAVRPSMGFLIAAISLVDAAVLFWADAPLRAAGAVVAVLVTMRLQSWVPGD